MFSLIGTLDAGRFCLSHLDKVGKKRAERCWVKLRSALCFFVSLGLGTAGVDDDDL